MSKYEAKQTSAFKKDLKRLVRQGKDMSKLGEVANTLLDGKKLNPKHKDHALSNSWSGFRDCHVEPDWALIYKIDEAVPVLTLTRTGSHSELEL